MDRIDRMNRMNRMNSVHGVNGLDARNEEAPSAAPISRQLTLRHEAPDNGTRRRLRVESLSLPFFLIALALPANAQPPVTPSARPRTETAVITATGTFDVKLAPQPEQAEGGGAAIGRMTIDKQFHGDLAATSKGQMLAVQTSTKGSAGYVAAELVTGTLHGRTGTFVLQHNGVMNRGAPQLAISVIPDSGTGELVGLAGTMTIDITDGKHSYRFEYTLPGAK